MWVCLLACKWDKIQHARAATGYYRTVQCWLILTLDCISRFAVTRNSETRSREGGMSITVRSLMHSYWIAELSQYRISHGICGAQGDLGGSSIGCPVGFKTSICEMILSGLGIHMHTLEYREFTCWVPPKADSWTQFVHKHFAFLQSKCKSTGSYSCTC